MKLKSRINIAVATAVALGCGVAQAATVSAVGGAAVYSQQGQALSGTTAAQTLPQIRVLLNGDYSVNDNIVLTIAGATVGGATDTNLNAATGIVCESPPLVAPDGNAANDPIIVSFINRTANTINLRVTQKNVLNTVGDSCFLTGIQVTAPSVAVLTTVTAAWAPTTAITNIPFDAGTAAQVASVIDQFSTGPISALNGVVDVNDPSLRREFTTDDGVVFAFSEDTLTVTTNDNRGSVTTGPSALLNTIVATVNGDFSFVDDDNNGCTTGDFGAGANNIAASETGAGGATVAISSNCQTITWTYTPPQVAPFDGAVVHTFTFGKSALGGNRQLTAPQQFTGTVAYNYTGITGTASESDAAGLGEWRLNGFSAFVPYMPYGDASGISQIIYFSNKSNQAGAVTVDAINQAGTTCNFNAGTVQAGRVTILSAAIKAGLEACYGGVGFNDRVAFTLTANVPAGRAELVTAYNVNGNRVQVINTSNGRVVQGGDSTTGGQL